MGFKKKACHKKFGKTKYQNIIKCSMNTLRRKIPIQTFLIDEQETAPRTPDQTIVCANFNDGNNLSKNIFFACDICEGPLVPITICIVCKKAEMRRCTRCLFLRNTYSHDACKCLIAVGSKISKKYSMNLTV